MMKKWVLTTGIALLGLLQPVPAQQQAAVEKSQTIVYIGGEKYRIHTVRKGETLYAIARTYETDEQTIVRHNPSAADGIKVDQNLKIPVVAAVAENPTEGLTPKQEKKLRRKFLLHTVAPQETLYAISRRYGISVEILLEDNANLDPAHLNIGTTLRIRKTEIGKTDGEQNLQQIEAYKETLNSVSDDGFLYHVVQPKETLYALARRYETTEEAIRTINDGLADGLKAGSIIRIPAPASRPETLRPDLTEQTASGSGSNSGFARLEDDRPLRTALLLPLATGDRSNTHYTEFYQGFLLGLDSIKRTGRSIDLDVYNTAHDPARIESILADGSFAGTDLIVGPVYEDLMAPVVRHAETHRIPVVSPLAHLRQTQSDVLFQLAPDPATKFDKLETMLNSGREIVLVYTQTTDRDFEQAVKSRIPNVGYSTFHYAPGGNAADLLSSHGDQILVVMSDQETEVDRVLAALASAYNNIVARGLSTPRYCVVGSSHWSRFQNIDRNLFFKNRVTFIATYHAKRDDERIRDFDETYIEAFGSLPTLYSYRGYDTALLFCGALFDNPVDGLAGVEYRPLQTPYRFERPSEQGTRTNSEWVKVSYNDNYTITTE